jgi:hypothetical protein
MTDDNYPSIDRCWLIECSRCNNESASFQGEMHEARAEFAAAGWTAGDDGFQMCPACNGVDP